MSVYKILLADDEIALRFLLTETLSDEGYAISEVEDGQQAMEQLQKDTYDLIILDYMMPERTGVEVCEWLRHSDNANRDIPVILLTAKALDKDKEKAKAAGVTTYIVKPFSPLQLIDTVGQLLQR
ncbi:response regulator [Paenibacillus alginolyticus]|uniref:Response regulator n=1 Tax=Paenibacillus alginolyticus TaxID=59839 RepID=A0ABT4GLJ1_9BACL|nr:MULTISPECIES: response regulator [Paenibacillus]MCY9666040.1 response regulator [Paenibacillus alginolyticus]MCY9697015.1 response regulator [Paenibacillus alginolyticus]MEC0148431.1 response regulator [Paenibacillus alginolyticus]NRF90304.1 response regulator [Paenibacillus frigoriresistens]